MLKLKIKVPQEKIAAFCQKHHIRKLAFFGSVLRDDFRPDSDIDVLVEFELTAHPTLLDSARMKIELEQILDREVDLVSRRGVETSRNYIRRQAILESAQEIYAA